jgi:hypothetical protein
MQWEALVVLENVHIIRSQSMKSIIKSAFKIKFLSSFLTHVYSAKCLNGLVEIFIANPLIHAKMIIKLPSNVSRFLMIRLYYSSTCFGHNCPLFFKDDYEPIIYNTTFDMMLTRHHKNHLPPTIIDFSKLLF